MSDYFIYLVPEKPTVVFSVEQLFKASAVLTSIMCLKPDYMRYLESRWDDILIDKGGWFTFAEAPDNTDCPYCGERIWETACGEEGEDIDLVLEYINRIENEVSETDKVGVYLNYPTDCCETIGAIHEHTRYLEDEKCSLIGYAYSAFKISNPQIAFFSKEELEQVERAVGEKLYQVTMFL